MPEQQSHGPSGGTLQHLSSVAIYAIGLALATAWLTADFAPQWLTFLVVAGLSGYVLYNHPESRAKRRFIGGALVFLVLLAPVVLVLPDVLVGRTFQLGQTMTVVYLRLFVLLAVLVGYVVYRLDGNPGIVHRLRGTDGRMALAGYAIAALLLFLPVVLVFVDLIVGAATLTRLSPFLWRLLGLVAVGILYGTYRYRGGQPLTERTWRLSGSDPELAEEPPDVDRSDHSQK